MQLGHGQILFLDQCYPIGTKALKFSFASQNDFPYCSSNFANLI